MTYISDDIPIEIENAVEAIYERQGASWNGGVYYDAEKYDVLNDLYITINQLKYRKYDYMFKGDIFRIHCPQVKLKRDVDAEKEIIVGNTCADGSCSVLPITIYNGLLSSFSSCHDFTRPCFYKVIPNQKAVMLHFYTKNNYGFDVNKFLQTFGYQNEKYYEEHEILFPMDENFLIKEYKCTPNQFNYYMNRKL